MAVTPFDYTSRGWKIFPVHTITELGHCTCNKGHECTSPGKHGRTRHGVKDATDDTNTIMTWIRQFPYTNWGLACGVASNILVIDIDPSKGGQSSFEEFQQKLPAATPDTLVQSTGGGGRHLVYRLPDGVDGIGNPTDWLPGVDIRGNNGHIVAEPSLHVSSGTYNWMNWEDEPTVAPTVLIDAIIGKRSGKGAGTAGLGGLGASAGLKDTDEILAGLKEGSRDDSLFRMACRLRRQLNDNRMAVELIVLEAARRSDPPFPDSEARRKVDQAFVQDHTDLMENIFASGDEETESVVTEQGVEEPLYRLTDMGNRDRFVREFGNNYRFVTGVGWHLWTDIGWAVIDDLLPHRDAQSVPSIIRQDSTRVSDISTRNKFSSWANDSESASRIANIMTLAKGHPKILKQVEDFNSVEHEIACRNGMVNLRDGSIRPFVRDDLFTRNTNVVYDPTFRLPAWEKFLEDTTRGDRELIEYLQMAAGYSLTGSIAEEAFFIISGAKQSGKSTYMDGLLAATGAYNDVTAPETFMKRWGKEPPREEIVKFNGSRIISTSELPEGERFDDAFLKRITGGDKLTLRYLYKESFDIYPQFKLWMATNHDPVTTDSAMFRRIKRVPFPYTVPEHKRDKNLKGIIKDPTIGGKAVLAWAVEGAIKYYQQGELRTPSVVVNSTRNYQVSQDSFLHFVNDTFWSQPTSRTPFRAVYDVYSEWSKKANERPVKRPVFIQKLKDKGHEIEYDDRGNMYVSGLIFRTDVPENILYANAGGLGV